MKQLTSFALLLFLTLVLTGCGGGEASQAGVKEAKYHCPMHPTYVDSKPSDCPICGMRLVPIKSAQAATDGADHAGHSSAPGVPGRTTIMVPHEKRQTIGLATTPVEVREFKRVLRTTGIVTHDETRLARIAPRFGGWVRSLNVNFTGQPVEKGQPLFTAYSPDVFTTETEYLLASQNLRRLSNGTPAEIDAARDLVNSARRRLELLEIGPEEIASLEKRGKPSDEILFRAPVSGHVITKNAVEGKAFMAGETLYEIGHLDQLWVRASVPEYEIGLMELGMPARVFVPGGAGVLESKVAFISPHLDPQTRRAEVRLDIDNAQGKLRPEMWVNVEIEVPLGSGLAIPTSAVIDTGMRLVTFVDRDDEHLEPRVIKVSARTDDYMLVNEGLEAGERVVSRALFLVDSESQLKAAIAGMTSGEPAPAPPAHNH